MINRYTLPEMAVLWNERYRYCQWLKVEVAICEQMFIGEVISEKDWVTIQQKVGALLDRGGPDPKVIERYEDLTKHDVTAFTNAVADEIGPVSRFIHYGLTSSDVVDTALSMVVQDAGKLILKALDELITILRQRATEFKDLPTIGRSHGIFAEPTSFGLKFLGWYREALRNRRRLKRSLAGMKYGKLSGTVGVNNHWDPFVETAALKRLGLKREKVSTQVLPRDRHAEFLSTLAILGSSLERIALELRHLQRSEVGEVQEGFSRGQKGSSAMPHKRNPISSENLTGCARLLRSYSQAAFENIALWHERDISHSSVERVIFPDATTLAHYMVVRLTKVLRDLVVHQKVVTRNLAKAGPTIYSGHLLLGLVNRGVSREEAYQWIQECALKAQDGQGDFLGMVSGHPEICKYLSPGDIQTMGSVIFQLRNVNQIYQRGLFRANRF